MLSPFVACFFDALGWKKQKQQILAPDKRAAFQSGKREHPDGLLVLLALEGI